MTIVLFIFILAFLIFIHELGHFVAAKAMGMKVTEFAVGFKPALFQKKIGETNYVLGMLPLGGYVSIPGEDGKTPEEDTDSKRLFTNKAWWQKLIVLLAGVTMNLIGAVFVLTMMYSTNVEVPVTDYPLREFAETRTIITSVVGGTPADIAKLTPGSEIVSLTTNGTTITDPNPDLLISTLSGGAGGEVSLVTEYAGERTTTVLTPTIIDGGFKMGVSLEEIGYTSFRLDEAFFKAVQATFNFTVLTFTSLGDLVGALFTSDQDTLSQVSGPIGIVSVVSDAQKEGFAYVLFITALISINLAVLNVLPIPALDGGRALIVIIEAITRKAIPASLFEKSISYSFYALIFLMVIVTIQDIYKLF